MYSASANSNILPIDIESFHSISWDYTGLSINPNITLNYVLTNANKPWVQELLLVNPAITLDAVMNNLDYFNINNVESYLCSNPNINMTWINRNLRSIHWPRLSRNHFNALQYVGDTIDL